MRIEDLIQAAEAGRTLRQVLEATYGKTAETIGVEGAELYQYQHDLDRPITRLYLAVDGTMALVAGDTIWHDGNTMNVVTSTDEEAAEEFRRAWALVYPLTTAERIAELLLNDGMRFETEDGRTLDELTEEAGGHIIKHETDDLWRHVFPDGSAIVMSPGAWDIEGSAPFSWAGAE